MKKYKVASYIRISRDESYSKSDSIDNQIKLTDFYCKENKLEVIDKYIDNGYSGTSFDRPSFKKLLKDIDEGLINTVVVKDLSRLVEIILWLVIIYNTIFQPKMLDLFLSMTTMIV